jgi:hypothetical protein
MDERNATNEVRAGRVSAARARLLPRPLPRPNPAQMSGILKLTPGRNSFATKLLRAQLLFSQLRGETRLRRLA